MKRLLRLALFVFLPGCLPGCLATDDSYWNQGIRYQPPQNAQANCTCGGTSHTSQPVSSSPIRQTGAQTREPEVLQPAR